MHAVDNTPDEEAVVEAPAPEWGAEVDALLTAAAASSRVRIQSLGRKAVDALDALKVAVDRDKRLAEAEALVARLKRGED